jgi:sodium-dependent dicarboxylate transporter 2/3/5
MLLFPTPTGMSVAAWHVAAVTVLMAVFWVTEAIPIPATALLPIAAFPLLGVMPSAKAAAPYADHLIYLFIGGFFLAVTMERWNLHKRVALHTLRIVGTSPARIVLGFMVATALLSMWVSNTATAMMMVPIGLAVIRQVNTAGDRTPARANFGASLMLGIAYAASIGGVATLIGTPPNIVMASMMNKMYGIDIGFARWMLLGVPLSAVTLAVSWILLTRLLFPARDLDLGRVRELLQREVRDLGPMALPEKLIVAVGSVAACGWISRGFLAESAFVRNHWPKFGMVQDSTIGIACALALFAIPVSIEKREFLLDWKTAVKIPWGVVVLFGGGLALASGFSETGLADYLAGKLQGLQGMSLLLFVGIVVLATVFMTEITSNTATATLLVPIMGSAAIAMGIHPYATIVAACLAASFAFMLPVATPPNAVVFGSGCLTIRQMARAGIWLNIAGTIIITVFVIWLLPAVFGVNLDEPPDWDTMPVDSKSQVTPLGVRWVAEEPTTEVTEDTEVGSRARRLCVLVP